jgi:hypothetical protein
MDEVETGFKTLVARIKPERKSNLVERPGKTPCYYGWQKAPSPHIKIGLNMSNGKRMQGNSMIQAPER